MTREAMTRARPWIYAIVAAVLGGWIAARWYLTSPLGTPGPDVDQWWWMARQLMQGQDPYAADQVARIFRTPVYYPLTAAVLSLPLALLPLEVARGGFVIGTAGLLGYALGKHRPELWPMLGGMPMLMALRSAQWSPALTAAMLLPWLGWLAAAKPNLGVAMLAGARSAWAAKILVVGGLVVVAVSLLVAPGWPWAWRTALESSTHFQPLLMRPCGVLVLLALVRWKDPDARLILALGLVPITGLFYDILPVGLVARSWKQALALMVVGHVAWMNDWLPRTAHTLAEEMWLNGRLGLWFGLLPALALVLLRDGLRLKAKGLRLKAEG
jgi:hypothetical protein